MYFAYLAALGNPSDAIVQANALTAAELKVERRGRPASSSSKATATRTRSSGSKISAHRAERKLGIKHKSSERPTGPC